MNHAQDAPTLAIEEWPSDHPGWADLRQTIEQEKQTDWVNFTVDWHQSSHILVASRGEIIAGFLRYEVQEIGRIWTARRLN